MESFGFESDVQGLFSEVSEVEMIDVIGGGCGGGCGGPIISCECWGYNYGSLQGGK